MELVTAEKQLVYQIFGQMVVFFTGGFSEFFFALSLVVGAYQGVELIGITAGEAKDPKRHTTKRFKVQFGVF